MLGVRKLWGEHRREKIASGMILGLSTNSVSPLRIDLNVFVPEIQ